MAKHTTASRSSAGSKREVAPGKWVVRVSDGYRRDGKRRRLSRTVYGTERDADRAISELVADMGRVPDLGDGCTLRDYWDNIYHPRILARTEMRDSRTGKRKMARGTLRRYEAAWRRRIEPAFGDWDLADIRHAAVQAWAYHMPRSEAEHSVRLLRTILREAWSYDELLSSQPLPRPIDLPGDVPEQARVWTPEELMRAMPLLRDTPIESIWLVMAGGGLRREEAYALWWHDLRFETVTSIHLLDDATTSREECLCSVPIDDAYTVDDGRKDVKTARGRRVVTLGCARWRQTMRLTSSCARFPSLACPTHGRCSGASRSGARAETASTTAGACATPRRARTSCRASSCARCATPTNA